MPYPVLGDVRRQRRQALTPAIDNVLPDAPTYNDGMWHPDPSPAAPAVPAPVAPALGAPSIAPASVATAPTTLPVSIASGPSPSSIAASDEASSQSMSMSAPPPSSSVLPEKAPKHREAISDKDANDDSGFKVAYLTPVFVLVGVFLVFSLGGRLWGKVWRARKRETRRRDRHARRLASELEVEGNQHGSWHAQPSTLYDKEMALGDGHSDFDDDDDDGKQPSTFHILSQRILGDTGRVAPPTSRARTGKYENKVNSNPWWSVQVRRMVSPDASQVDGGGRYTAAQRPLRHAGSRDRLRQMRGDLESAPAGGTSILSRSAFADEKPAAQQRIWSRLMPQWMAMLATAKGPGTTSDEPREAEKLWGGSPLQSMASSVAPLGSKTDDGGGFTTLPQPKFASSDASFARHPSTLSVNNLRSRSRGYYKPLPEIVNLPTPASPSKGQFSQLKESVGQSLNGAWKAVVERSPMAADAAARGTPHRVATADYDGRDMDDLLPETVIALDRTPSQPRSEAYSATETAVSSLLAPPSQVSSQKSGNDKVSRSRSKRRPGTTYMYDEQLPMEEAYQKTPSPVMETPRKWRPQASSSSSSSRSSKGSYRDEVNVLTPPAKMARSSSKSQMLLERVRTQQQSTTDYLATVRPLNVSERGPHNGPDALEVPAASSPVGLAQVSPARYAVARASPSKTGHAISVDGAKEQGDVGAQRNLPKSVLRTKTLSRTKTTRQRPSATAAPAATATATGQLTAKELTDLLNTPGLSPEMHASTLADLLALYEDEGDAVNASRLDGRREREQPQQRRSEDSEEPHLSSGGGGGSSDEESLATDTETATRQHAAAAAKAHAASGASAPRALGNESVADKSTFYTPLPGTEDEDKFVPSYMQLDEPGSLDHVFNVLSQYVGAPLQTEKTTSEAPATPKRSEAAAKAETPLSRKKTWMKGDDGRWYRTDEQEGSVGAASTNHTPIATAKPTPHRRGATETEAVPDAWRAQMGGPTPQPPSFRVASPNPLDRLASPPPVVQSRHDLFFASPASPTSVVTRPRNATSVVGDSSAATTSAAESTPMPSFASVVSGGGGAGTAPLRSAARTNSKTRNWLNQLASTAPLAVGASDDSSAGDASPTTSPRADVLTAHPPRKYQATLSAAPSSPFSPSAESSHSIPLSSPASRERGAPVGAERHRLEPLDRVRSILNRGYRERGSCLDDEGEAAFS
ncbi:hypothetical protein ACQY0O_006100 [Thecaphora frezii]